MLQKCESCGMLGRHGAQWILIVGNTQHKVHKPCGDQLAKTAPEGVKTNLFPSPELRRQWQTERNARKFWNQKFQKAEEQKVQAADKLRVIA